MKAQVLEGWEALGALEPEWNALLRRSRADCPFLTWEWIDAWRRAMGGAVRPVVVAVRDEAGALAGLGPFYATRLRLGGILPFRTLRVLGDHLSGAEYPDLVAREDCEAEAALEIARALAAQHRWSCLWLPGVSGSTGARGRIIEAVAAAGLYWRERPCTFAAIELPGDAETYERSLSSNARSMLRRRRRQVLERPGTTFRCAGEADRGAFVEALFELNHRRWRAAGLDGTFVRKPLEASFYRAFTPVALERGWLRAFALERGRSLEAVQLGYVYGRTFYQLQEGFDPAAPEGVGNVLRSLAIERLIAEGVRSYDFLGEFTEHKRRWLARPTTGSDVFIGRPGLRAALLFSAGVWPTGRYLRPAALEPVRPGPPAPGAAARAL